MQGARTDPETSRTSKYWKGFYPQCSQFVDKKLSLSEWLPLIGITISAFVFNTSEFMPVGLLTDIVCPRFQPHNGRRDGGSSIPMYAWAVMVLSLPLMILGSRLAFRPLMLLVLGAFCAGQVLSALAVSYGMLMCARLVVACAHSVFLGYCGAGCGGGG